MVRCSETMHSGEESRIGNREATAGGISILPNSEPVLRKQEAACLREGEREQFLSPSSWLPQLPGERSIESEVVVTGGLLGTPSGSQSASFQLF